MVKRLLLLAIILGAALAVNAQEIAGYSPKKAASAVNAQEKAGYSPKKAVSTHEAPSSTPETKWTIGGGGGVAMPLNLAKEFCTTGSNAFANATYNLTQTFSAGCEVNYTYLTNKTAAEKNNVNTDFFALMAKGVYTYKKAFLSPYFALNFGWYKAQEDPGEFGYSGEVGVLYSRFNLGVGYHVATSRGFEYLQLNLGYRFSF